MSMMTENTQTDQPLDPIVPIYGPSDPRYGELMEWLVDHADEIYGGEGRDPSEVIRELTPTGRASWWERGVLGRKHQADDWQRVTLWPLFSHTPQPSWAGGCTEGDVDTETERPVRMWHRELDGDGAVRAAIIQEEMFNPESGEVTRHPVTLSVWLTDEPFQVTDPEEARTVARALLRLADELATAAGV